MATSKILQELEHRIANDNEFAQLRNKAVSSLALTVDDTYDDSSVYKGYIIDVNDSSVFQSKEEIDKYVSVLDELCTTERQ